MDIGTIIKDIRKKADMTQEKLSTLTGLSQTSLSQIESGAKRPSNTSLKKICKALHVPEAVVYILSVDESDVPPSRKKIFDDLYPEIKERALKILNNRK